MEQIPERILFYDGDCGFCNRAVAFVLKRDASKTIYFASLQSEFTQELFAKNEWKALDLSTVYFYDQGVLYDKSTAALRVVRCFNWYRKAWLMLTILPKFMRDWGYDQIAKRRRKISKGYCVIPTPEQYQRFLSEAKDQSSK